MVHHFPVDTQVALCGKLTREFERLLTQLPPDSHVLQVTDQKVSFLSRQSNNLNLSSISSAIKLLIPWRSGPFEIDTLYIDTEWISSERWKKIKRLVRGKRFLDLGAGSGFFMYQLLQLDPEIVLGIDPVERCFLQWKFLNHLAPDTRLNYWPCSSDELIKLPSTFDTILSLGVIYHQKNPELFLSLISQALKQGGRLILETITIDSAFPLFLAPNQRYAKMRNAPFIPTVSYLSTLLINAGFVNVTVHDSYKASSSEQRSTKYAPYESLVDFLNSDNPNLTVEGYPAPYRTIFFADKRNS